MVESISQLGYLMRVPHNEVRKVLTDTLSKLYTDQTDITDLDVSLISNYNHIFKIFIIGIEKSQ